MMDIKMVSLKRPQNGVEVKRFGYENAQRVQQFHRSFPDYHQTPLAKLPRTAKELGLGEQLFPAGAGVFRHPRFADLLRMDVEPRPRGEAGSRHGSGRDGSRV